MVFKGRQDCCAAVEMAGGDAVLGEQRRSRGNQRRRRGRRKRNWDEKGGGRQWQPMPAADGGRQEGGAGQENQSRAGQGRGEEEENRGDGQCERARKEGAEGTPR